MKVFSRLTAIAVIAGALLASAGAALAGLGHAVALGNGPAGFGLAGDG